MEAGVRSEAYGAFAYAYDESLGKSFFAALAPLLDGLLEAYPARERTHLDLACGTGLAMEYFERKGFVSTGVDASVSMLGVGRDRAARRIAGDLREVPLRGTFGRLTCFYDSLNHLLRTGDLVHAFRSVRRLMNRDSIYLFDINHPEIYLSVWSTREPFEARGLDYRLSIHTRYSRWRRLGIGRVRGWAEAGGKRHPIDELRRQRAWSRAAILRALDSASLAPVEIIDFDPFPSGGSAGAGKAKWLFLVRAC